MKRILSYSLVLSLCLLLSLPAVADAFLGRSQAVQLSGTYILSEQQGMEIPTEFLEFTKDSFTLSSGSDTSQGTYSITRDSIEFVHSCGRIFVFPFSRTQNTITFTDGNRPVSYVLASKERIAAIEASKAHRAEEERRAEEARRQEEARRVEALKAAGFIALSDNRMNWADAKAWCQQQGGRLPRINNRDSWNGNNRQNASIDGFGNVGRPWAEVGLPADFYWTGTRLLGHPDNSWGVGGRGGTVSVSDPHLQILGYHVACVPISEAERKAKAEEEARKTEAERKAQDAFRAAGFIALSESSMNWVDAKAFCQQQGGRLPRINNSDSLAWNDIRDGNINLPGTRIDGFGNVGRPWAEVGLPAVIYTSLLPGVPVLWRESNFQCGPG